MYDIKPLEEEWKKYRKKREKPWYVGGFLFLIIGLLVIVFSENVKIDLSSLTTHFKSTQYNELSIESEGTSHVLLNESLVKLETENIIAVEEKETKVKKAAKVPNILVDIPVLDGVEQPDSKERKNVNIDIQETSSMTAYKDVEKRFLQSHDVDDSLFLAKSYYKKGYYKEAEYWALETNKLDSSIEESVFIFVKSKVKLGHNNEAESILTNYITKTASQEAKNLLFKIKNDRL